MTTVMTSRQEEIRARAFDDLRRFEVVMEGHFDYGNGFHGRVYLNPHQLFRLPSTIWRVAQDLIDVMPSAFVEQTDIVAGPVTGGALLAHTLAGLLDGRRALTHPPYSFAPFGVDNHGHATLSPFYQKLISGRRVLIADDVRNTGQTFKECADLVRAAGGTLVGTVAIVDRMEAEVTLDVPNVALVEYTAPPNHPAPTCPLCASGVPITAF
jgi:orotate phosphoribosyltransferase